jgi:drug/metabolite transporter (DMT)-like permease
MRFNPKNMKTRDYWITCFKIYTTMSVLTAAVVLIVLFVLGMNSKLSLEQAVLLVVVGAVFTALWSVVARMFKRKSPKAIVSGYSLIGLFILLQIIKDILNPTQIGISDLIIIILYAWFISCVYKAKKQTLAQPIS